MANSGVAEFNWSIQWFILIVAVLKNEQKGPISDRALHTVLDSVVIDKDVVMICIYE